MTTEQEEKIRKIFGSAGAFAVVADKYAGEAALLAKEALVAAIKNSGRMVYQFPRREQWFSKKWSAVLPPDEQSSFIHSTSLLIPKGKVETKEISYAEDDAYVRINITSAKENITKENIVLKPIPSEIDAMFYFANNDQNKLSEETTKEISDKIHIPQEEKIIIITSGQKQETLSVKTFDIMEVAGQIQNMNKTLAPDMLLASLAFETGCFKGAMSARGIELISTLSKMGADKNNIDAVLNNKENSFIKLLGRAMARSAPNESPKTLWTFVSQQDLEKTGNSDADENTFYELALKIKELSLNDSQKILALVWQKKEEVWVNIMPRSNEEKINNTLIASLAARNKNGYLLCGPYKNFSEAEIKIQNALKEIT